MSNDIPQSRVNCQVVADGLLDDLAKGNLRAAKNKAERLTAGLEDLIDARGEA